MKTDYELLLLLSEALDYRMELILNHRNVPIDTNYYLCIIARYDLKITISEKDRLENLLYKHKPVKENDECGGWYPALDYTSRREFLDGLLEKYKPCS